MSDKRAEANMANIPPPAYAPADQGAQYTGQYSGYPVKGQTEGQPLVYTNQPQQVVYVQSQLTNPPNDHMAYAIFVTFCCCWPIGIFAIMKAMESKNASNRGDRATAEENSRKARSLSNWALGIGIVVVILTCVAMGLYLGLYVFRYIDWD